jgi:hypothetical protein
MRSHTDATRVRSLSDSETSHAILSVSGSLASTIFVYTFAARVVLLLYTALAIPLLILFIKEVIKLIVLTILAAEGVVGGN